MSTRKAAYAASLDPITNGHLDIIERMAPLYDKLMVLVAVDPRKTYMFTPEERVEMAKAAVSHLPNVSVDVCLGRYVVKQAEEAGAQVIIRGLRNFKDLEDEQILAEENRNISPGIETVWIPCRPQLMHVSSSMVKSHVGVDPEWEEQVARSVPAAVVSKLKEKYVLGKARKHWAALMAALGNPKGSEKVFENLLERYREGHRAYHTLEHIVAMLDELALQGDVADFAEEAWAIWHHDGIYNPRAHDNEERSVDLSSNNGHLLKLPEQFIDRANTYTLATKHDVTPEDPRARLVVDLDLMILGKSEKEFDRYEAGIRTEYSWVPENYFLARRAKLLHSFLDRPSIYSTETFRKKYEQAARQNLERSIERVEKLLE